MTCVRVPVTVWCFDCSISGAADGEADGTTTGIELRPFDRGDISGAADLVLPTAVQTSPEESQINELATAELSACCVARSLGCALANDDCAIATAPHNNTRPLAVVPNRPNELRIIRAPPPQLIF